MDDSMLTPLDPPRIVNEHPLLIAGLNERYDRPPAPQSRRSGSASRRTWITCPARSATPPTA